MRSLWNVIGVTAILVLAPVAIAQESRQPDRGAFPRGAAPAADKQLAGRLVSVEVVIADVAADVGGDGEMTIDQLNELEKAGKVISLSRLKLAALENQQAVVQFGERVPVTTGRVAFPGGRGEGVRGFAQESVSQENLGTLVTITPRVDEDESILMEFQAEQSRLVPAPAGGEGGDAAAARLSRTATISTRTTLRILPGKSVVAGARTTKAADGIVQTWILVSAQAEGARPQAAQDAAAIKVFALANCKADEIAQTIQRIYRSDNLRIGVDGRTNSLIVQGTAHELDEIHRLIIRLDEAAPAARPSP